MGEAYLGPKFFDEFAVSKRIEMERGLRAARKATGRAATEGNREEPQRKAMGRQRDAGAGKMGNTRRATRAPAKLGPTALLYWLVPNLLRLVELSWSILTG